jgi:hypothetical protein
MKSSSRLLIIFGAAIGAMVLVAIILVLVIPAKQSALLPEDTPEGTIQRYFLALQNEDYAKAYSFITQPPDNKMTYDVWRGQYNRPMEKNVWKVTIGKAKIIGGDATVDVIIDVFRPQGPLSDPVNTNRINFSLKKAGASWTIISPYDLWWMY